MERACDWVEAEMIIELKIRKARSSRFRSLVRVGGGRWAVGVGGLPAWVPVRAAAGGPLGRLKRRGSPGRARG